MSFSIDQQVAQLANEGHQEIAVIKLPSQAKSRKKRKPSSRKQGNYQAQAYPVDYNPAPSRNLTKVSNRANAQYKSDRVDFIIRGSAA
jgi:hypothetical protein